MVLQGEDTAGGAPDGETLTPPHADAPKKSDDGRWRDRINWENTPLIARLIVTKLGLEKVTPDDRSLIAKVAALAQGRLSEHLVWDSIEAVRVAFGKAPGERPDKPRCGYWHGTLSSMCTEAGENFNQLLAMIELPAELQQPPKRETAGAKPP